MYLAFIGVLFRGCRLQAALCCIGCLHALPACSYPNQLGLRGALPKPCRWANAGRWEARIGIPGSKHIYLGLFNEEREAARMYDAALVRPFFSPSSPFSDSPPVTLFFQLREAARLYNAAFGAPLVCHLSHLHLVWFQQPCSVAAQPDETVLLRVADVLSRLAASAQAALAPRLAAPMSAVLAAPRMAAIASCV